MPKNIKTLVALSIAFILCLSAYGSYFLFEHFADKKAAAKAESETLRICTLSDDITNLTILNKESENSYTYNAENKEWNWDTDSELPLYPFHLSGLVSSLKKLAAERSFDATDNLSAYGFNEPAYELKASDENGFSQHLLFGKSFEDKNTVYYYVMEKNGNIIYTVADTFLASLDINVFDMAVPDSVPSVSEDMVRSIVLTCDGNTTSFRQDVPSHGGEPKSDNADKEESESSGETSVYSRYVSDGTITIPVKDTDTSGDGTEAYELFGKVIDAIDDLKFYSCADWNSDPDEMTSYGFDEPYAAVFVEYYDESASEEKPSFKLTVGGQNESGEYNYAMLGDSKMICLMKSSYVSNLLTPASSLSDLLF